MRKTTLIIALSMIVVCMSFVCSCKKDPRKEYNSCCKTIKKNLGRKAPNNLDEAIGAMDWEAAHKYIGCYALLPEEKKESKVITASVTKRVPDNEYSDEESNKPHETSVMRGAKERLLRAEATYLIQSGAPEKALAVATELGVIDIYQNLLAEQFSSMMKEKRYDEMISVLSNWKFEQDFVKQREHRYDYVNPTDNDRYNSEVSTYNDYVDALLNKAIIMNDYNLVKQCMVLYVPNAVYKTKTFSRTSEGDKYYILNYALENTYKKDALAKIHEAGMKL